MTKESAVKDKFFETPEVFFPPNSEACSLLVGCSVHDFSASLIARAVEDCDARLLNLNVTSISYAEAPLTVALRINHRDPSRVIRSLERYGYSVLATDAPADADDRLQSNYDQLMRILEL